MASLSENMKNKRDVKRKYAVLVVDSDLGNIGLYKAILSMEYDVDCALAIDKAEEMCRQKEYDVILADGNLGMDTITAFFDSISDSYNQNKSTCLVMSEPDDREQIIRCMCHGAYGYISKPFTRESMAGKLHEVLKDRREKEIKESILIMDESIENLKLMKACLEDKYIINIMNSGKAAVELIDRKRPDLIIADVMMPELSGVDIADRLQNSTEAEKIPVLFMAESPDMECLTRCEGYKTAGFMVKPVDREQLKKSVERILLVESYSKDAEEV